MTLKRRHFLAGAGGLLGSSAALTLGADGVASPQMVDAQDMADDQRSLPDGNCGASRAFNGSYHGEYLDQIAFPLGGMGAGMICLEGSGALTKFSLRHRPDLERERRVFAAISIKGARPAARMLEGPVPIWKLRPQFPDSDNNPIWGLPRFHEAAFEARFPFATVHLTDPEISPKATVTAWSPFSPGDADTASLPLAGLEYRFVNESRAAIDAVFSFNAENILASPPQYPPAPEASLDRIRPTPGGFILCGAGSRDRPWDEGQCAAWVDDPEIKVDHAWELDSLEVVWRRFAAGEYSARPPTNDRSAAGASLFVPFTLGPGEAKTVTVCLAWYVPQSNLFEPTDGIKDGKPIKYPHPAKTYQPWYAGRFPAIKDLIEYWRTHFAPLRQRANKFSHTFYDSSLPPEILEAVSANLSILKSTTVLRQMDGRLWGWEGSMSLMEPEQDLTGVSGTTTHVWNYAQSIAHLFPALERGLRETEFGSNQNDIGLQYCRTPLPIRQVEPGHSYPDGPAADGQLGGIIKLYRDWRISGDSGWLRRLWPRVRASLDYCIRTWDPAHRGWIEEPHLTTYDLEFWGADGLCTGLYLGALKAVTLMAKSMNEPVDSYSQLLHRGVERMQTQLFNGEYYCQSPQWTHLLAPYPPENPLWRLISSASPEWLKLERTEGPPGQYRGGCLADGVLGVWLCWASGIDSPLDRHQVESHLTSVHRYNFKRNLSDHASFMGVSLAGSDEAGMVLCTWPNGGRPPVPILYADEVWTGTEYQVASHLIAIGKINEGLDIVRATRRRYDGRARNPFGEAEAGHWYARAMSSYALLEAFSGARYDAVDRVLYLTPAIRGDYRSFLATATGYGTVGVKNGNPFLEVVSGEIAFKRIQYTAAS
jgi:uncharacterized protein (DUF608 family)